jgi:hypothetical protein
LFWRDKMFLVIRITDNVLNDIQFVGTDRQQAQDHFIDACRNHLTNFCDYSQEDIDNVLDEGYAEFVNGSICLVDTDGWSSDAEIRDMLQRSMKDLKEGRGSVYPAGVRPSMQASINRGIADLQAGRVDLVEDEDTSTRKIEMAVIFRDGTWSKDHIVEVPANTPEDRLEVLGREAMYKKFGDNGFEGAYLYAYDIGAT